jgi:hypothetical protein
MGSSAALERISFASTSMLNVHGAHLRTRRHAFNMRGMKLSRTSKAIVALLTAACLLLCQTLAFAQMCGIAPTPGQDAQSIAMPCHMAAVDDGAAQHSASPGVCDVSQALPETAKVPVFALADLPVLLVEARDAVAPLQSVLPQAVQAVCSSRPLTVLHCRLLI